MPRKRFSTKDRARIFAAANGVCHICGVKIDGVREVFEIEHVVAYALTRDNSDENLRPAHKRCHEVKTRQEDVPAIAKAKRREAKHTGAARPAGKLKGRGFPAPDKPARITKQLPPRRPLYATWPAGMNREGD